MSRHRDVRNMDYTDEYDGYDDVYGHSVDDDFYISPSNRQFMYNRESSRDENIQEEDEQEAELSDSDKLKLDACIKQIQDTMGPMARNELVNLIMKYDYNVERILNAILETQSKEKDLTITQSKFIIPPMNGLKNVPNSGIKPKFTIPKPNFNMTSQENNVCKPKFNIPKPNFSKNLEGGAPKNKFLIPSLKGNDFENSKINELHNTPPKNKLGQFVIPSLASPKVNSLSEYAENHLKTVGNNDLDSSAISQGVSQLKLEDTKTKSLTEITTGGNHPISNDWHIDLSQALKVTNSYPSLNKNNKPPVEKFEIEFIDCELNGNKPVNKKMLPCTMNLSNVLSSSNVRNVKKASRFGRVLCKKYRQLKPLLLKIDDLFIRKFDFKTASPDDLVQRSISRARSNK